MQTIQYVLGLPLKFYCWLIKTDDLSFDWNYMYFIVAAQIFHTIAWGCTVYVLETHTGVECIQVTAYHFQTLGYLGTWLLQSIYIVGFFIAIPILFAETRKVQFRSALILSWLTLFLFVDALNDVAVLMAVDQVSNATQAVFEASYGGDPGYIC